MWISRAFILVCECASDYGPVSDYVCRSTAFGCHLNININENTHTCP